MAKPLLYPARLAFRLSANDADTLQQLAEGMGIPPATLARRMVTKSLESPSRYPANRKVVNAGLLREIHAALGRMTGLTNQLAARSNADKAIDAAALASIMSDVAAMRAQLRSALNPGQS